MATYAKLEQRLFTVRMADSEVIDSGTSWNGPEVELPGPEKMAAVLAPVAVIHCAATGSPDGGNFEIQVQSSESSEWLRVPGAAWTIGSGDFSARLETGPLGAAMKIRLRATGLSGLNQGQDYFSVTVGMEGAI